MKEHQNRFLLPVMICIAVWMVISVALTAYAQDDEGAAPAEGEAEQAPEALPKPEAEEAAPPETEAAAEPEALGEPAPKTAEPASDDAEAEEETEEDVDYYINKPTLDIFEQKGASPHLLELLKKGLGDRESFEIEWSRK